MIKKIPVILISCLMVLIGASFGWGSQEPASNSRTVRVDVIVTQKNEPVKDLAKSDFRLFEDGKEVPLDALELIEKKPEAGGIGEAKKLVIIFHDMSFWEKNIRPQVDELTNEIVKLSGQGIEIMVLRLNWRRDLSILQPFTLNEELIRKAAEKATASVSEAGIYEDLWTQRIQDPGPEETQGIARAERGVFEAFLNIEQQRFERALGGLLAVCNMVKSSPGRKSILLVSSGIPDLSSTRQTNILSGEKTDTETLDAIHGQGQERIGKVRIFDPFDIMKKEEFSRSEDVIREVTRFANTYNISIYALDPGIFSRSLKTGDAEFYSKEDLGSRALGEEERGKQLQNLRIIAEDTNAVLFRGANKFDQMHQTMDVDLSSYYQLTYAPTRKKADSLYHKLEVKTSRAGVDVRARKGYRDYAPEEMRRYELVSAYYSPETFRQLPFEAEFLPFYTNKGKYVPWVSIALATRELFLERGESSGSRTFELNIWLKRGGERAYGGRIDLPFKMDSSFLERLQRARYLWFFFTGPELDFSPNEYQAVLALVDQQTNEIGTWHSLFIPPDLKKSKTPLFMNFVLGSAAEYPERGREVFSLNADNGNLEYGSWKFVPQVTNRFSRNQTYAYAFLQVYDPQGTGKIQPEFSVSTKGGSSQRLEAESIAESWNKKSRIWSGIFRLDFGPVPIADNVLQVRLGGPEGEAVSSREISFKKLDY